MNNDDWIDINKIPEVKRLYERCEQIDRALRRLSMALGNPCIQGEFESIDMGLVEYAINRISELENK